MTSSDVAIVGGAVGAIAGVFGGFALRYLAQRHGHKTDDRAKTILEYQELLDRVEKQLADVRIELQKVYSAHVQCQVESAELRAELRIFKANVSSLEREVVALRSALERELKPLTQPAPEAGP